MGAGLGRAPWCDSWYLGWGFGGGAGVRGTDGLSRCLTEPAARGPKPARLRLHRSTRPADNTHIAFPAPDNTQVPTSAVCV